MHLYKIFYFIQGDFTIRRFTTDISCKTDFGIFPPLRNRSTVLFAIFSTILSSYSTTPFTYVHFRFRNSTDSPRIEFERKILFSKRKLLQFEIDTGVVGKSYRVKIDMKFSYFSPLHIFSLGSTF